MPRPLRGQYVVRGQQLPTLYLCTKSYVALTVCEILRALRNWVTSLRPRPLRGQFAICEQELPAVCQCATSEERSFIRDEDMAHFPSKD